MKTLRAHPEHTRQTSGRNFWDGGAGEWERTLVHNEKHRASSGRTLIYVPSGKRAGSGFLEIFDPLLKAVSNGALLVAEASYSLWIDRLPDAPELSHNRSLEIALQRTRSLVVEHNIPRSYFERARVLLSNVLQRGFVPPYVRWSSVDEELAFIWIAGRRRIAILLIEDNELFVRARNEAKVTINGHYMVPPAQLVSEIRDFSSTVQEKNSDWRSLYL